jgi:hypothetical protein
MSRLVLAAFLTLAPVAAQATIMRAVPFDEKVENAAAILVGTCTAQQSRWDDAHNWILTYSTFRVEQTIKGQPAQEITVVTPGGTVGTVAQEVIGVPQFKPGEENVVFVRNSRSGPTVLYLEQGSYRVAKEDRGEVMVIPAVTSSVLVDTGRGTAVTPEKPRSLRDFEGAVRETMRRHEAMRMEMIERRKAEASIWQQIRPWRALIALALLGAILASWQIYRRW